MKLPALWVFSSLCGFIITWAATDLVQGNQQSSLVRRHNPDNERASHAGLLQTSSRQGQALVSAVGNVAADHHTRTSEYHARTGAHHALGPPIGYCNINIKLGPVNSDNCTYGTKVSDIDECSHAVKVLRVNGYPNAYKNTTKIYHDVQNGTAIGYIGNYIMDNVYFNPLPYPTKCFLSSDDATVKFNPTQSSRLTTNKSNARPICKRELYPVGVIDSKAADRCDYIDTSGDYEPIPVNAAGFEECLSSLNCTTGMESCRDSNFDLAPNFKIYLDDAPPGCYRRTDAGYEGCINFNWKASPTNDQVSGAAVCRLKVPQVWATDA